MARFGEENFTKGDALDMSTIKGLGEADIYVASPPCAPSSNLPHLGTLSSEPQLIPKTRELLQELGKPWIIENVQGSVSLGLLEPHVVLRNRDFGLRANRARVFESSYQLVNELDSKQLGQN